MATSTAIDSFDDLLRLTDTADVTALEELLLGRTQFHDDDGEAEVESTDIRLTVTLGGAGIDGQGFELAYPFGLKRFWHEVEEIDRLNGRRVARRFLPQTWLEDDGSIENEELLQGLATYFEMDREEFDFRLGGGWASSESDAGAGMNESNPFWIVAGDPAMVALGLGNDWVDVASPTLVPAGMAGPSWMELDTVGSFDLNEAGAVDKIAAAIKKATAKSIKRCGICWNCRTLQENAGESPGFVCRACMKRNGAIFC